MLKVWNIALIIATYSLVLFGTFLTRSGVIGSVHSFGQSGLGPLFLVFIGLTLAVSVGLLVDRLPLLRSEHELDSFVSRESSFLFNNLLLVGAAFATFWGTVFPIISEAVRGVKITVGAPFFNQVNGPIFLALVVLMGIYPLIGWRRASRDNLLRNFLYPVAGAFALAAGLFALGQREFYVLLAFWACAFVAVTLTLEFCRGVRARHNLYGEGIPIALVRLVSHNRPRYGGYIVHLGVILFAVGVAGSSLLQAVGEASLATGESLQLKQYTLINRGVTEYPTATRRVVAASLEVVRDGKVIDTLSPSKEFHPSFQNPVSEVAIRTTLQEDLYVILAGWADDYSTATVKVLINPLVVWLWIGGIILLLGTAIAVWPEGREARRPVSGRQTAPAVPEGLAGVTN
ncbi:MAG: cytochrome c-type biogenesis CcmF C-terminal domain-containing protein [Chloroflexota bacterium]